MKIKIWSKISKFHRHLRGFYFQNSSKSSLSRFTTTPTPKPTSCATHLAPLRLESLPLIEFQQVRRSTDENWISSRRLASGFPNQLRDDGGFYRILNTRTRNRQDFSFDRPAMTRTSFSTNRRAQSIDPRDRGLASLLGRGRDL